MSYKTYWLRGVLAVILLGYGGRTIYRAALKPPHIHIGEIIFWGLGPGASNIR